MAMGLLTEDPDAVSFEILESSLLNEIANSHIVPLMMMSPVDRFIALHFLHFKTGHFEDTYVTWRPGVVPITAVEVQSATPEYEAYRFGVLRDGVETKAQAEAARREAVGVIIGGVILSTDIQGIARLHHLMATAQRLEA
ncbi:MAG: hypothetical protein IIA65_03575, partial [Planctomycetes bacterium]|nr:hypothetical protein [Planctomycetota bacterium]